MRIDPDREVAVEPEGQPSIAASRCNGAELPVGLPLQVLKKLDPLGMDAGKFANFGRMGVTHRRRPMAPRKRHALAREMLVQGLEHGETGQRLTARSVNSPKFRPKRG